MLTVLVDYKTSQRMPAEHKCDFSGFALVERIYQIQLVTDEGVVLKEDNIPLCQVADWIDKEI